MERIASQHSTDLDKARCEPALSFIHVVFRKVLVQAIDVTRRDHPRELFLVLRALRVSHKHTEDALDYPVIAVIAWFDNIPTLKKGTRQTWMSVQSRTSWHCALTGIQCASVSFLCTYPTNCMQPTAR